MSSPTRGDREGGLRADGGSGVRGPAPVTLKYQWKANGVAITGATAGTYTRPPAMLGKTLTFTVTGSKSGFTTTVTKTSAVSVKVAVRVLTATVPNHLRYSVARIRTHRRALSLGADTGHADASVLRQRHAHQRGGRQHP